MINRRNYKNICVLLALTSISCSDSEGWMSGIPLSNEKISFTASLQEGWSGGQGSGDKSRAVKPDFPGLAREQKVLTTDEAFSKPLYLHPIETVNKTLKNQGPTTRGTMNFDPVINNFGVSANYIPKEGGVERSLFLNEEATQNGNYWFTSSDATWPLDGSVSFYAYAPYNDPSLQWKGDDKVAQNKTIHYKVPENVEEQPDFIVANSEGNSFKSSSANTPVDLQFHHALTAITFSVSDDMEKGVINSIKIEGVKGEGDYNYDLSDPKWDSSKSTAAGSYTVSFTEAEGKVDGQRALTGGVKNDNKVLMMIPQTLDKGAKVTINFTPAGGTDIKKASFPLGGTKWDPGRRITYVLSTTKIIKLNMGSVTYPQWQTAKGSPFTPKNLKSDYASGDFIGMYVVDKYNKVIEANLKFTYKDGKWTVKPGKEFKGSPQYNYFVYYPYQEGGLPGAPAKNASNIDVTSAASFFADAITEWGKRFDTSSGNTIDQSDIEKMNSFDLQIGKADGLGESGTTINFSSMTHAMGLAEIVLDKNSFTNRICYLVGYEEYPTWNGTTTSYASSSIKNHTMYGIADHRYVSIVKPGENSFMSATDKDAWKEEVKLSPAANEVKSGTAYNSDNTTTPHAYTLAVGDIYYSDGAITKPEDISAARANGKTPIGVIGYLGNNKWTESGTGSGYGGHALVLCLKNIGSNGTTDMGQGYQWYSKNEDCQRTKVDTGEKIRGSSDKDYGSGYKETSVLDAKGSEAAYAAKNYTSLPAPRDKCTGWFLPSAGQYYAVMSQLGGGISPDTWGINGFFGNMTVVSGNINAALSKVGPDQYTEFFQGTNTWVWTSSEFSSTYAVDIDSGVDDGFGSGSVRFGYYLNRGKTHQKSVRPFLAF